MLLRAKSVVTIEENYFIFQNTINKYNNLSKPQQIMNRFVVSFAFVFIGCVSDQNINDLIVVVLFVKHCVLSSDSWLQTNIERSE